MSVPRCVNVPPRVSPPLFPVGVEGLGGPHELLQRTRQKRPPPHGHPGLGQSLQGQKTLHYIVVDAT